MHAAYTRPSLSRGAAWTLPDATKLLAPSADLPDIIFQEPQDGQLQGV